MIRILCIVAILGTVGAEHNDTWKQPILTHFFNAANYQVKSTLYRMFPPDMYSPEGTDALPSTKAYPTDECTGTFSNYQGAEDHNSLQSSMKRFLDTVNCAIAVVRVYAGEAFPDSTYAPSSTTVEPTTERAKTSSEYQSTLSTTAAYEPNRSTTESSNRQYPIHVGSIRGIPGVNFPDYTDIPLSSFSCSDKDYIPGFYADMETGCQVFHVCWPHRRESFLCPLGTIFNQALLACDYWYSSNCSLAPIYYNINDQSVKMDYEKNMDSIVNVLFGARQLEHFEPSQGSRTASSPSPDAVLSLISQFLPVRAKVTVYPETESRSKIVATSSVVEIKHRGVHHGKHASYKPASAKKFHSTSAAPEFQYSTQSPVTSTPPNYAGLEKAVKQMLNEVFETVRNVIRDSPKLLDSQESKPTRKPLNLGSSLVRGIVKPVALTESKVSSVSQTPGDVTFSSSTEHPAKAVPKKPVEERIPRHQELSVSSMTKKALATNYLRLLKIRKAQS